LGEALDLFERRTQRNRDRYRFGMLVANAKRVHITTSEATIDDEPILVSPFVDEVAILNWLNALRSVNGFGSSSESSSSTPQTALIKEIQSTTSRYMWLSSNRIQRITMYF
jgi:hypothetical protein